MLHGSLHCGFKLDAVNGESSTFDKVAILFLDGSSLERVQGKECRLTSPLISHVLDTLDGSLFVLDDDSIETVPENGHDGSIILASGWFAQVDDSAMNAYH